MKFRCVEVIKIVKLITNRNFPEYRKIFPTGNCELSNCHPVTKIAPQSSKIPKKVGKRHRKVRCKRKRVKTTLHRTFHPIPQRISPDPLSTSAARTKTRQMGLPAGPGTDFLPPPALHHSLRSVLFFSFVASRRRLLVFSETVSRLLCCVFVFFPIR